MKLIVPPTRVTDRLEPVETSVTGISTRTSPFTTDEVAMPPASTRTFAPVLVGPEKSNLASPWGGVEAVARGVANRRPANSPAGCRP